MAAPWLFLLAAGAMVLVGFLAAQLFDRFRLPDYFILMAIGLVLGSGLIPLSRIDPALQDPRAALQPIAPLLTSVALAFILFEGGLVLHVRGMLRAWGLAAAHTLVAMVLAIAGMWLIGVRVLGLGSTTSLVLALAFCGPSATIVLSFLPRLDVSDRTRFTLTVEGVMGNIVAAVLILMWIRIPGTASDAVAWVPVLTYVAVTVVVAALAGLGWSLVVGGTRQRSFAYMTSVAMALALFAVGDGLLQGNGGLAAFVFGLVLGVRRVLAAVPGEKLSRGLAEFHRELVFLLRTFFFLYLGIQVTLSSITPLALMGAVAFTGVFFVSRLPSSAVLAHVWKQPPLDRRVMRATVARGMTDTVLVLFAIEVGVIPATEASVATDLLFLVILVAALASALLVFRAEWIARRAPAPARVPATTEPGPVPLPEPAVQDLDRALAEFLEDPLVRQGEID